MTSRRALKKSVISLRIEKPLFIKTHILKTMVNVCSQYKIFFIFNERQKVFIHGKRWLFITVIVNKTLANICAGIYLLMSKQLSIDDYVRLSTGEEGRVADITWRFTTIIATSGNAVVVPNQKISSAIITNYCMPEPDMTIKVLCGVAYDSDLDFVEQVTLEVAWDITQKIDNTITKKPGVYFHTFNESSIDFNVVLHCSKFADQFKLKHEFIKALTKRYRQEGIEIPFPIRTVYNRSVHEEV